MADSKEKLFSDFSPVSTEQWMEKVTADLKGADFEKKLIHTVRGVGWVLRDDA